MPADRGRAITDAILEAIEDGNDRVTLAWPGRPGGGFAAAAIALREARASGRLASGTLALWPWRNGATWSARSILVHPGDIAQIGARAADEIRKGASWAQSDRAQSSLYLLEMRLRDLTAANTQVSGARDKSTVVVRSPTLLETTSVFPPREESRSSAYTCDGDQVLRRVRDHTHLGDKNAGLKADVGAIGDPMKAPFAVFGLPSASKVEAFARYFEFPRLKDGMLDAIVVDATRSGRAELSDNWEQRFTLLLQAVARLPGRRPPVVVLTEEAFSLRKAVRALRSYGAALHPPRPAPKEVGAYLPQQGLLGPAVTFAEALPPMTFEADIKDASLAGLRRDLVALGRTFKERGERSAADGVSKALALLRRSASLPVGLREARDIADILNDGDDEEDIRVRSLFRPKVALGPLASAAEMVPELAEKTRQLIGSIEAKMRAWEDETPVSAKLAQLFQSADWNSASTLLAMPDRWVADVYWSSDRALRLACDVVDHRGLSERLSLKPPKRVIVIGPTPEAARALLTAQIAVERIVLLGDAAGVALLSAEIGPLGRIAAFAPFADRARAMAAALQRGGANEQLDLAEAEFRIAAAVPEGEIDLTRAGEAYRGDVLHFTTSQGHRIAYRPTSDVLQFSPGEMRPFEPRQARQIQAGDRVLVLNEAVREPIRRALAGSREALKQLSNYHSRVAMIRASTPGTSDVDKARHLLAAMQSIDPGISSHELPNVIRWLTADKAPGELDGARQPRAARDWARFRLFMRAANVDEQTAKIYWLVAIVPARAYRVQEGYLFNQRVIQFVLDPEGAAAGTAAWKNREGLWQLVLDAVDEVVDVRVTAVDGARSNG